MKTGYAGLSVQEMRTEGGDGENQRADLRKEIFRLLEEEREKVVRVLHEDVAQLISIAKMELSGHTATSVNTHLSMALAKLRALIFELKPHVLQQFDLTTALIDLFNKRFNAYPNRFSIDLHQLPQNLNQQTETAIFRLVQKSLSHVSSAKLAYFALHINRTGKFICLQSRFELEPSENDMTTSDYCETSLKEALNTLVYLFHGKMHCKPISDNQMEFVILLDENKLQ